MLKYQVKKYNNARRLFSNPDKAVISGKEMRESQFFSLNFPIEKNISRKIMDIIEKLKKTDPGHKYITAAELHCTVKSFGLISKQLDEKMVPKITGQLEKILKDFPSFEVYLNGTNNFQPVAFIQVFSKDGKLLKLHNLLNKAIPRSEYPHLEGSGYTPHITIAYFSHKPNKLFSAMKRYKNIPIGKMKVVKLDLIKGRTGRQYVKMKGELINSFQLK